MIYKKIKMLFYEHPDRFNRTILVPKDINLVHLGCIMACAINATFEHFFLFHVGKTGYVPEAFQIMAKNWYLMKDYNLEDLGDQFIFEYDTGEGYRFKCKVYKKEEEIEKGEYAYLLDGKGQGIFEDNISSLYMYLDEEIDPNTSENNEDIDFYMPWNLPLEKISDFDDYDLEFEKESFGDEAIYSIYTYLEHQHECGYEMEINDPEIEYED